MALLGDTSASDGAALDAAVDSVYATLAHAYPKASIQTGDLVGIALHAMRLVEPLKTLAGAQKKDVVVAVLRRLAADSELLGPEAAKAAEAFITFTLPPLIDSVIDAANTGGGFAPQKCCAVL